MSQAELDAFHTGLAGRLDIPVLQPLRDGVGSLVPVMQRILGA